VDGAAASEVEAGSSVEAGNVEAEAHALIEVSGLSKVYDLGEVQVPALQGVDLLVQAGEFVAVTGPSGSGKSTLMHILGCLDRASSGTYLLDGVNVDELEDEELAAIRNRKIGFVFQSFNLLARTTALENVELPLIYARSEERTEIASEALARVGLRDRMYHRSNELSGGQQQRVAIARALVNRATQQGEEIMDIFQQLNDSGITVVLVTHESDIAQHAKRALSMRDGRVESDEPIPERLKASELLAKLP
jgi:putative ABC transport system ATP-binding protein